MLFARDGSSTGGASSPSGTGSKLTRATIIVAGVAALVAVILSFISMWMQLKSM